MTDREMIKLCLKQAKAGAKITTQITYDRVRYSRMLWKLELKADAQIWPTMMVRGGKTSTRTIGRCRSEQSAFRRAKRIVAMLKWATR